MKIINSLELLAATNGPGHRMKLNAQLLFYFFQQIKTISSVPIHFIHEHNNRRIAHPANLHQAPCLLFNTIHAVDYKNDTIDGRQCTECILSKVFVTWSIQ